MFIPVSYASLAGVASSCERPRSAVFVALRGSQVPAVRAFTEGTIAERSLCSHLFSSSSRNVHSLLSYCAGILPFVHTLARAYGVLVLKMNCPDRRNDDEELDHPEWNQNPPRFAADLTTCQDMNGIANARELGDADRLCRASPGLRHCELEDGGVKEIGKERLAVGMGVKGSLGTLDVAHDGWSAILTCTGPCTQPTVLVSDKEEHRVDLKSWATWLLSVLATSTLISLTHRSMFSDQSSNSRLNTWTEGANTCHRSSKLTVYSYSYCSAPLQKRYL